MKKKDPEVFRELFKIGGSIYIKFYKIHFLFYERTHTFLFFNLVPFLTLLLSLSKNIRKKQRYYDIASMYD